MEEDQKENMHNNDNEVTLKDMVIALKEYLGEIYRYWWIVVLCCIPTLGFFVYKAYTTPKLYFAELTFMLNEDTGGGGGFAGILGTFGIGGTGNSINLEKMVELAKTRTILSRVLFNKIEVSNDKDYIINHIIKSYDFHEDWEDNEKLKGFLFKGSDLDSFTRTENKVYKKILRKLLKDILKIDLKETGIIELKVISRSEDLSLNLTNDIYDVLSSFYLDKSIEKQSYTYENSKSKSDSIALLLVNAEYALADFRQKNRNLQLETELLKQQRLSRAVLRLNAIYAESLKITEQTKYALDSSTPFIQVIDRPLAPLFVIVESKIKAIAIGLFLGFFLAISFILGRKIIREALV